MFLETLRSKQKYVLWILVLVVVPSFVLVWGSPRQMTGERNEVEYGRIDGVPVTDDELIRTRHRLTPFLHDRETASHLSLLQNGIYGNFFEDAEQQLEQNRRDRTRNPQVPELTSDQAGRNVYMRNLQRAFYHLKYIRELDRMGLGVGSDEIDRYLRRIIRARVPGTNAADDAVSTSQIQQFKEQFSHLSNEELREGARQALLLLKYKRFLFTQSQVTEAELYPGYIRERTKYVARWKDFLEEDYRASATEPAETAVRAYYEEHKDDLPIKPSSLYSEPKIRLAYVGALSEKAPVIGPVTKGDLTKHVSENRREFRRPLPLEAPDVEQGAPIAYVDTPFPRLDQVENDVRKHFLNQRSQQSARRQVTRFSRAYEARRRAIEELPETARQRGVYYADLVGPELISGETPLLTAEELREGKNTAFGKAPGIANDLMDVFPENSDRDRVDNREARKNAEAFFHVVVYDNDTASVKVRVAEYQPPKRWSFEEAKPTIVKRLRQKAQMDALNKAVEECERAFGDGWRAGKTEDLGGRKTRLLRAEMTADEIVSRNLEIESDVVRMIENRLEGDIRVIPLTEDPKDPSKKKGRRVVLLTERRLPTFDEFLAARADWMPRTAQRVMGVSGRREYRPPQGYYLHVIRNPYSNQTNIFGGYVLEKGIEDLYERGLEKDWRPPRITREESDEPKKDTSSTPKDQTKR